MKKLKRVLIIVCAAALVMSLSACGSSRKVSTKKFEWPTSGLATLLPKPETDRGEIKQNSDSNFHAELSKVSEEDFEDYINACKDYGYTIESEKGTTSFQAYNENGYEVRLSYYSSHENYDIYLYAPTLEAGATFTWPTMGMATLIPEPSSNVGKIRTDSATKFSVYVGEFSSDDFNSYVNECIAAGFDNDYDKTDTKYKSTNDNGDELTIYYEGFNVYSISVTASDEEEAEAETDTEDEIIEVDEENEEALEGEAAAEEETIAEEEAAAEEAVAESEVASDIATAESTEADSENASSDSSSNLAGVSDEFKDAMDTYEEFFDEYVEFMKKYNESGDTISMLSDFTNYMTKYAETMEKLDALEDEMSPAETKYYLEVMGRINKKLAELY